MHLVVGLGNPGQKYQFNRHNAGFLLVNEIARQYQFGNSQSKFDGEFFKGDLNSKKVILVKPQTFMNLSGKAVSKFQQFYKIDPDKTLVAYDDLDVPFGKVKVSIGGGTAGHNGLKSINSIVSNNYVKLKIGIGRPEHQSQVESYVLSDFSDEEKKHLDKVFDVVTKNISILLDGKREDFLTKISMEMNDGV
ncbi:MAG: aminoacyl-tRNA hydrolase [Rickettsiales bacterium]